MFPLGKFLLLYGYDYRRINDKLTRFNVSWKKHSHVLHLGLDGYQRGKNASLQYNTTLYAGKVEPDSDMAETLATLETRRVILPRARRI